MDSAVDAAQNLKTEAETIQPLCSSIMIQSTDYVVFVDSFVKVQQQLNKHNFKTIIVPAAHLAVAQELP